MREHLHGLAAFLIRHRIRGGWRFQAWVCRGDLLRVTTKHGVILRIDPTEFVSSMVLHHGYYEEEVLQAALEGLRPGEVFWDIGSCLGLHALTVARLRPAARVTAFEPNPIMATRIEAAARENGLTVAVRALALGAKAGPAEFFVEKANAGMSTLGGHWGHSPEAEQILVPVMTADGLIAQGLEEPHVIKIDTEGSELDVLRGMAGLLAGHLLRRIVFEDGTRPDSEIKRLLSAAGFAVRQLTRPAGSEHGLENFVATR